MRDLLDGQEDHPADYAAQIGDQGKYALFGAAEGHRCEEDLLAFGEEKLYKGYAEVGQGKRLVGGGDVEGERPDLAEVDKGYTVHQRGTQLTVAEGNYSLGVSQDYYYPICYGREGLC